MKCLRDPDTSGLSVFMDDAQRIFPREGRVPIELVQVTLDENLRSTKQIAQVFGALSEDVFRPRGMDGPPVRLVDVPAECAVAAADDAVDALLDEGWAPGAVTLLVTLEGEHRAGGVRRVGPSRVGDGVPDRQGLRYGRELEADIVATTGQHHRWRPLAGGEGSCPAERPGPADPENVDPEAPHPAGPERPR